MNSEINRIKERIKFDEIEDIVIFDYRYHDIETLKKDLDMLKQKLDLLCQLDNKMYIETSITKVHFLIRTAIERLESKFRDVETFIKNTSIRVKTKHITYYLELHKLFKNPGVNYLIDFCYNVGEISSNIRLQKLNNGFNILNWTNADEEVDNLLYKNRNVVFEYDKFEKLAKIFDKIKEIYGIDPEMTY